MMKGSILNNNLKKPL